jgi:hypothetical protein
MLTFEHFQDIPDYCNVILTDGLTGVRMIWPVGPAGDEKLIIHLKPSRESFSDIAFCIAAAQGLVPCFVEKSENIVRYKLMSY